MPNTVQPIARRDVIYERPRGQVRRSCDHKPEIQPATSTGLKIDRMSHLMPDSDVSSDKCETRARSYVQTRAFSGARGEI